MKNDSKTTNICSYSNPARGRTFRMFRRQTALGITDSTGLGAWVILPAFYSSSISFVLEFLSFLISSRSTV